MSDEGRPAPEAVFAVVSPLERWLWGWAVRRALRDSSSRFYLDLPKRGREGATYNLMATMWAIGEIVGVVGIVGRLLPGTALSATITVIGFGLMLISLMFTVNRAIATSRATRIWKAAHSQSG